MRIGKYETVEFLGGGMSEVYRATDTVLGRTVALKILTTRGAADEQMKDRFLLEARVSSGISHDHIVTTYDYGEDEGRPFIIMEFLVGESLRQAIDRGSPADFASKAKIALQLAKALQHIHSLNIIHRDVKPDNIHLDASGKAKLMDFGIAKAQAVNLTRTGLTVGTPHYMAPEVILGQPVTHHVDLYSFGVVLFELLAGRKPIQADTVERIVYLALYEPIPFDLLVDAGVPEPLRELVAQCMARHPAERIQSFAEVREQLEQWLANPDRRPEAKAVAAPVKPAPRRRQLGMRWVAIAGAATVALAILTLALLLNPQPPPAVSASPSARLTLPSGDMVLVDGGAFPFGPSQEKVELKPYYIDVTEVTNEDYHEYCRATNYPLPKGFEIERPGYPVVNITVRDAKAFAQWAGKRLPTEEEWERAARGIEGRRFSWGTRPMPRRRTCSTTRATRGATWCRATRSGPASVPWAHII